MSKINWSELFILPSLTGTKCVQMRMRVEGHDQSVLVEKIEERCENETESTKQKRTGWKRYLGKKAFSTKVCELCFVLLGVILSPH